MISVVVPLMTPDEYARHTGLSRAGVKKMLEDGRLPSFKLGDSKTCINMVNIAKLTNDLIKEVT